MNIGEHIKSIRISKGLTQSELSEKSGVALRTIQRIENSEVNPSIYSLKAIGTALDVNLNEPQFRENDKKFEFKIVVSNFSNLLADSKTLIKRISASTINCGSENECDIELVKKDANGKLLWKIIIGGTSYDKFGQLVRTNDGSYIVVGSTSSFGKGNYDVLAVKVNSEGEIIWQKTYGEFLNDYGLRISLVEDNLYKIEATKQICSTINVSNDCFDQEWLFRIDESGIVK